MHVQYLKMSVWQHHISDAELLKALADAEAIDKMWPACDDDHLANQYDEVMAAHLQTQVQQQCAKEVEIMLFHELKEQLKDMNWWFNRFCSQPRDEEQWKEMNKEFDEIIVLQKYLDRREAEEIQQAKKMAKKIIKKYKK